MEGMARMAEVRQVGREDLLEGKVGVGATWAVGMVEAAAASRSHSYRRWHCWWRVCWSRTQTVDGQRLVLEGGAMGTRALEPTAVLEGEAERGPVEGLVG